MIDILVAVLIGGCVFVLLMIIGPPKHKWCDYRYRHQFGQWHDKDGKRVRHCIQCGWGGGER